MKIIGTGSYLPDFLLTNEMLTQIVDTSDEWITERTGMKERKISTGEGCSYMAIKAAERALLSSGLKAEEIDLVIVATVTSDYFTPSLACLIQGELGISNAIGFDINAACSGFMYGLSTVYNFMSAGTVKNAIVVGVETVSRLINYEDRGTCILFGDAAGAVVVKATEGSIFTSELGSDGSKSHVLYCKQMPISNLAVKGEEVRDYLHMDGQEVYKFVVKEIPGLIKRVVEKSGLELSDIKYFVLHQANKRMNEVIAKKLKQESEKFPSNLHETGNTSAASIPVLLDKMNQEGKLTKGDKIVLCAFGGGLTWAANVMEW